MKTNLVEFILAQKKRLGMPIGVYPGLGMIGKSVYQGVTDPVAQIDAQKKLYDRYLAPFLQSAIDLSIEGEAFGCQVRLHETDIPTIVGRLVTSPKDLLTLVEPKPGHKRTTVPLTTVRMLKEAYKNRSVFVLGGMIGPFTLAGRLVGLRESSMLTSLDPGLLIGLLEAVTRFLARYATAFRLNHADGIILAEPGAGLISPDAMARFSVPYVQQIITGVQAPDFSVLYHNCHATLAHLPGVLETGAAAYHFGKPMDIADALSRVAPDVVLAGNLDPTEVFVEARPEQMYAQATQLLKDTAAYPNYILSSGCDLSPGTSLTNLDAFFMALEDFNNAQ